MERSFGVSVRDLGMAPDLPHFRSFIKLEQHQRTGLVQHLFYTGRPDASPRTVGLETSRTQITQVPTMQLPNTLS
jgi:hypothetical protein